MNCFNHPDKPAVGFYKSCCKGLCSDCAAQIENGLACKNACEKRVKLINDLIDNNKRIVARANTQVRSSGVFCLICGLVLCLGDLPFFIKGDTSMMFMPITGVIFILYGILQLSRKRLYPTTK